MHCNYLKFWGIFLILFISINVKAIKKDYTVYYTDSSVYDVKLYHLNLHFFNTNTKISGNTKIVASSIDKPINVFFIELSTVLSIDSVIVNGTNHSFSHLNDLIRVPLTIPIPQNTMFEVAVYYRGTAKSDNFMGGISNKIDYSYNVPVTYTLSEPYSAKDWFPCKQLLTDKADSVNVDITVPPLLKPISNGRLVKIENLQEGMMKYHWQCHYPTAYYLISITVSEYSDYSFYVKNPVLGDSILIQNYIYDIKNCLADNKEKIDKIKEILQYYESIIGPYPFRAERYGQVMAPIGGGMENITVSTIADFSFNLMAHELAHQWYGDMVTCGLWNEIWINEGFASYLEYLAIEKLQKSDQAKAWLHSAFEKAKKDRNSSLYIKPEDSMNELKLFNLDITYKKGALILHTLRFEIGNDSLFFVILKGFLDKNKYGNVKVSQFIEFVNEITKRDYKWFFDQWYYGYGYPQYQINWKQTNDSLIFESSQTGSSLYTPLFKGKFEIKLVLDRKSDTTLIFEQNNSIQTFSYYMPKRIKQIIFDPNNKFLSDAIVYEFSDLNEKFKIIPNPAYDTLNLKFYKSVENRIISIFDISGKKVFELVVYEKEISFPISDFKNGIYLIKITEKNRSYSKRMVKQ